MSRSRASTMCYASDVFPPKEKGAWRSLDLAGRKEWLARAAEHHFSDRRKAAAEPQREILIDGASFDDLTGFLCAMGEAVNGPGGYFGRTVQGFDDCLFGGFGLEASCAIRWSSSDRSRQCLDGNALLAEIEDGLARIAAQDVPADFDEGRAALLATAERAKRGERTLFDELVGTLESVRARSPRTDWHLDLRLE